MSEDVLEVFDRRILVLIADAIGDRVHGGGVSVRLPDGRFVVVPPCTRLHAPRDWSKYRESLVEIRDFASSNGYRDLMTSVDSAIAMCDSRLGAT